MASSFPYQFQPQPPPVPRMTGGKRGPSGPLMVSSGSEDEDSDTSECLQPPVIHQVTVKTTVAPKSPRCVQIVQLPTPRMKTGGGKFTPTPIINPRKDTLSVMTVAPPDHIGDETDTETNHPSLPSSPRESVTSPTSSNFATEHDHDYENVASPCSSTASGPIYVRPPGFTHHAQEVESVQSKIVRKKSRPAAVISLREGFKRREQTPPKAKTKRGERVMLYEVLYRARVSGLGLKAQGSIYAV
eukprot:GHVL01029080.1.p1 GENE.GHVL01029080.1~~GHVL01029080.1.p1  ORF type:complete len:244 (+),score=19.45 GHVL01029080.1:722-1453(+)